VLRIRQSSMIPVRYSPRLNRSVRGKGPISNGPSYGTALGRRSNRKKAKYKYPFTISKTTKC
jgi:hypothetical protein